MIYHIIKHIVIININIRISFMIITYCKYTENVFNVQQEILEKVEEGNFSICL